MLNTVSFFGALSIVFQGRHIGRKPILRPKPGNNFMKKIGFLSFGHWSPAPRSGTRSAGDTLLQSIDLAVAAEELGADGAYFRVHHFCAPARFAFSAACSHRGKRQAGSRSAPPSSTCAMKVRSIWSRMLALRT